MNDIRCNICNSSDNKPLFMKDGLQIIKCNNCKVAYVYPIFLAEKIKDIYDKESYYCQIIVHDQRDERERFPWEKTLSYMESLAVNKGRLLDIGSGTGFFIDLAQKNGWEVIGIEPSTFIYNYSIKKYNCKIINKTLKEADFPKAFFDVITLWNILEHLSDPLDMLLDVNKIIKSDGLIAFSVPNINSFEACLFGNTWTALDPSEKGHLYYFTPYTIKYILHKTGFKIEKLTTLGGLGLRAHILDNDNKDKLYNGKSIILEYLAAMVRGILNIFKKGGILIVVARKTKEAMSLK